MSTILPSPRHNDLVTEFGNSRERSIGRLAESPRGRVRIVQSTHRSLLAKLGGS